ncbi:MAG: hypothetical protein COV10_00470 [Candidatus Vogelbacteria bacterium CG10_big_fil_rev_8_21_14_0_10_51_16]|uniref:Uncharacterized protein n=1 Tax=Candidatus Vogelbacteria bacterium CG10_big_fil_rev_8_21_14_0_10_51_16 TaxID=1975045 RepID=A0A2H0RFU9_9BACT|nr:MAG: hypothetical protein COV10_00470 [Candidatus Vogelbacteria bacterium CG10_big_fil_rev_8_21_14_0_10_51_16]
MISTDLIDYIARQFSRGVSQEKISQDLMAEGGWTADDLAEAFRVTGHTTPPQGAVAPASRPSSSQSAAGPAGGLAPKGVAGPTSGSMPAGAPESGVATTSESLSQPMNARGETVRETRPPQDLENMLAEVVHPEASAEASPADHPSVVPQNPPGATPSAPPASQIALTEILHPLATQGPSVLAPTQTSTEVSKGQAGVAIDDNKSQPVEGSVLNATQSAGGATGKSRWVWATTLLVLTIIAVAGGAYGYFVYTRETPEMVLGQMLANLADLDRFTYTGTVDIASDLSLDPTSALMGGGVQALAGGVGERPGDHSPSESGSGHASEQKRLTTLVKGVVDITDLERPLSSTELDLIGEMSPSGREDVIPFRFGLDLRNFNTKVYVRVRNLPKIEYLDLSAFNGRWIVIVPEEVRESLGFTDLQKELEAIMASSTDEETEANSESVAQKLAQVQEAFVRAELVEVREVLDSEAVNGVTSYHYRLGINMAGATMFADELARIFDEEPLVGEERLELEKGLARLVETEIDVWIGKSDKQLRKFSFASTLEEVNPTFEGHTSLALELTIGDHNQPVVIEEPEGAMSFEEVFNEFLGEYSSIFSGGSSVDDSEGKEFSTGGLF